MRVAPCEVDDEGVGQDAPGRRVATLRDVLTRLPQGANAGELAQVTQGVQAGRASPRLLLRRRALEVEQCLELLTRPLGLALRLEVGGERVTHLDEPLDAVSRLYAKMLAMEIVMGVLIGRLSEEDPEVREDVKRDVAVLLADMPIDGASEELIAGEVRRAAEALTSVRIA